MAHANDTVQGTHPGTGSADNPTANVAAAQAPTGTMAPEHAGSTSEPDSATGEMSDDERPDAISGATVTAVGDESRSSEKDAHDGSGTEPAAYPGDSADGSNDAAAVSDDTSEASDAPDTITGATPGVAAACRDYGFTSPDTVDLLLGVKPPGER
ncbi:MAG: hypothetical protein SOI38_06190 [Eggerthellaceae bacterium]|jgi:hypothetical protein